MSFDLSRFHAAFFAESAEQLDAMEAELLRWDPATPKPEAIDTIFRAAHSVKGGSATFGFANVAGLTHLLETLLHEVRSGQRMLAGQLVDLLLRSVDCLRDLLSGHRNGTEPDADRLAELTRALGALGDVAGTQAAAAPARRRRHWRIGFRPGLAIMQRGNDPYRFLRELSELGEARIEVSLVRLPELGDLDPESCFLEWTIELIADVEEQEIEEIFEWVEGDCELTIEDAERQAPRPTSASEIDPAALAAASIRVDVDKIDQLINRVGELIVTESRLRQLLVDEDESEFSPRREALETLSTNIRDLQDSALQMRMIPLSFAFHRLPRLVRDLSSELGKEVRLELSGEQTELDKGLLETITDPLIHLVRNAVDHGIEAPDARLDAGKPAQARMSVISYYRGGAVIIEVRDDGRGLDPRMLIERARAIGELGPDDSLSDRDALNLVFSPGFSTASEVTDISGRGVGLDVVRRNIQKLGGRVSVESALGEGTCFTLEVPMTLSIIDGQIVRIGDGLYVVPVLSIIESVEPDREAIETVAGGRMLYRFRGGVVPLLDLRETWELGESRALEDSMLVIVERGRQHFGVFIDELLDHQSVVIKSLEENFRRVSGLAGATVLGDGSVALVLDVDSLGALLSKRRRRTRGGSAERTD